MKKCPQCGREYDNSMSFCLDDGAELLYGPSSMVEPATALLGAPPSGDVIEKDLTRVFRSQRAERDARSALADQQPESGNSIAVLPFANMSPEPDNEYFCDGLAEELLNALAKIDQLKVAARTSAFSFKGKDAGASEIGAALNVRTVLEGSVRKSGSRLRITAQLVNAADGYHLWSERYDREMKDIFDVQDEITLAVVEALKVKLLGREHATVLAHHTRNPEALELYLRGLSYFSKFTPEFFQKAIESFKQAIALDPEYASAYAGLAESYSEMSFFASPNEWMPKAKEAAGKALELDDRLGNAHNSLAVTMMYYDRDFTGAEAEFKRALALDPGSAHIQMWYGWFLGLTRRFAEGIDRMQRARELDPLSHLIGFGIGAIYFWSGQLDQAIVQLSRVIELNPSFPLTYSYLAEALVEKGDFAAAVSTIENAPAPLDDPVSASAVAYVYAKAGQRDRAHEMLHELERPEGQAEALSVQIAQIYVGLGDYDQAVNWLEKAFDTSSVWLIWLGVEPTFAALRSDRRFADLLDRLNISK